MWLCTRWWASLEKEDYNGLAQTPLVHVTMHLLWRIRHGVDGSHCPRWLPTWKASSSLTPPAESEMNILDLLHAQWQHNLQWGKKGKEASVCLLLWGPGAAVHLPKYVSVCVVNGAFSFDVPSLGMGSNGNRHGNKHAKAEKILIVSACVCVCVCVSTFVSRV